MIGILLCTLFLVMIVLLNNPNMLLHNGKKLETIFWNCAVNASCERRKVTLTMNMKGGVLGGGASGIGVLMCICFLLIVSVHADGHEPERNLTKELEETIAGMREEDGYRTSLLKIYQERTDVLTSEIARLKDVISDFRGESPSDSSSTLIVDVPPVTEEEKKSWYYYFFPKSRTTYFIPVNDTADAKEEKKCETFKCCSLMVVETAMDILWVAVTDPVNLAGKVSESVSKVVKDQLQVLSGILGTAITFTALNVAVYVTTKFSKICSKAKRLCGRMCDLPVPALGIDLFKRVIGWASEQKEKPALERAMEERLKSMTDAMEKIKEELKKPLPRREYMSPKCGYCGSSAHVMRDCPVKKYDDQKCHYCGEKGHIAVSCPKRKADQSTGIKPWKKNPRARVIIEKGEASGEGQEVSCSYCGKPNHTASFCLVKKKDDMSRASEDLNPFRPKQYCRICGLNNHTESNCFKNKKKLVKTCTYCGGWNHNEKECYKKVYDEQQEKGYEDRGVSTIAASSRVAQGEESGSGNAEKGESSISKKTRVYAPINFEGKRFSKCLIDTGAQANLMPAGDVTRHQFVVNKGGIKEVRGFNGSPGKILGTVMGDLQFGPDKGTKKVEFLVSPDVGEPIIGFPTLRDFGLSINCQSHEIYNESTGEAVLCSVVNAEKN